MPQQACLELWGKRLAGQKRRLPQQPRRAVIEQYERLIGRAAQTPKNEQGGSKE